NIFPTTCDDMKTVTIICRIGDESAVLKDSPIFKSIAPVSLDNRRRYKNGGSSKRDAVATDVGRCDRKCAYDKLRHPDNHVASNRPKCAAYVATRPPKTLPATTSPTK